MKKRIVSILLSMVLTITFFPSYVFAEDTMNYSYFDVYNNNGEKIGVSISGSSQTASGTINIPSEYNGYPVVEIESLNAKNVTCYVIPESVENISAWAFTTWGSLLTSFEVESGNQHYKSEGGVLYNADMTSLIRYPIAKTISSVTVPEGVTEISQNAFLYSSNVSEINLPSSLSSIGMQAFYYSQKLEAINVDAGNSYFSSQDGVLYDKNKTTLIYYPYNKKDVSSFSVPEGVTTVENYAFESGVNEITLPSTVDTVNSSSFNSWIHHITVANSNPNFVSIDGSVFSKDMTQFVYHYYTEEDTYTVPDGVTDIGKVLRNCSYSTIIFPEGITTIANNSLRDSNNLEEIYLPSTIETIEQYAFANCGALTTVNFAGTASQWDSIEISQFGNDAILNAKILCSDGTPSVPVEPTWAYENNTLTVTYDGKMCDYSHSSRAPWFSDSGRYSAESIVFEGNPVTIGKYAFYYFYCVKKIAIPEGITTIGESAFESCALKEIALPTSLQSIRENAFRDNNIESVYYAGSEEEWNKINGIDQLLNAEIIFNQSGFPVDSLEWEFADGILTISGSGNMPDYDTYSNIVPWNDNKNEITKVVVTGSFKNIGGNAFSDLSSLEEVVLSESIKKIGYEAFKGCSSLKNITIPQKVTTIESYAFSGCSALETITISEGVTNIDYNCFEDCVSLSTVTLPQTLSLSNNIFPNCTSLTEIKVAEGNTNLWVEDGVLFGKNYDDSATLLCYPAGKTTESYAISSDVTTLNCSFAGNRYIKEITGGEGLKYIYSAFKDCSSLSSLSLSDTIEYISDGTFTGCTSLKQLVLPAGLTEFSGMLNGSSIEEVTIPASISYIEPYMLESALSLKNINVDESNSSYTSKGGALFTKDEKTLVFYPKGKDDASYTIPTGTESIGEGSFAGNSHIKKLIISEDVRSISGYAFSNLSQLNEVIIKKGLTEIPSGAFYECRNLSKITIPATIKTVGDSAFYLNRSESASPVEVIYEGTQTSWDNIDFSYSNGDVCESENISFIVGIGDGVDWILKGNKYLLITGSGDMTDFSSEEDAPWYNADYTGDYLGEIYKRIEAVWIDGGITAIGDNAFTSSYTALTDIYFDGTREEWNAVVIGNGNNALLNAKVHCTDDTLGNLVNSGTASSTLKWSLYDSGTLVVSSTTGTTPSYYNAWLTNPCFPEEIHKSVKKLIIEEGITTIGEYNFAYLPMLYEVKLPSTLTTINKNAFYYCEKLTRINFPSSLTTIKGFNNCALREFNIPGSVTVLDEMQGNLFTEATIPDSISSISNRIFSGCTLLEEINIGKNTNITLTSINHSTGGYLYDTSIKAVNVHAENPYFYSIDGVLFSKADNILRHYPNKKEDMEYTVPNGTKGIGSYGFENVNKYLLSLTISEGVESIDEYGIYGCTIKEINLPESLKTIGNYGINGEITSINISEGLESVGEYGISSLSLEQIILPKSLKEIGPEAFRGCSSLKSVSIPDGVTSIGDNAFADSYKTFTVKIPASVTEIGSKILDNYDYYGSCSIYYGGTKEQLDNMTNNNSNYFRSYGSTSCYYLLDGYKNIYSGNSTNKLGIFIDVPVTVDSYSAGVEFSRGGSVTETITFGSYDRYGAYLCSSFYTDSYDFDSLKLFAYDNGGNPLIEAEVYNKPFAPDSVAFKSCSFDSGKLNAEITYDRVFKDCVMMLAIYDEGKLVEFYSKPVSSVQSKTSFDISTDKDFSGMKAKAFLWESLSNMKPIGIVAEKNVGGIVLESEHNYGESIDETNTYTYNGECSSIDVTFSSETFVESGYDFIYIYDGNDNLIGEYTGNALSNVTVRVPGNTIKIRITSDYSTSYYGYRTENIVVNK